MATSMGYLLHRGCCAPTNVSATLIPSMLRSSEIAKSHSYPEDAQGVGLACVSEQIQRLRKRYGWLVHRDFSTRCPILMIAPIAPAGLREYIVSLLLRHNLVLDPLVDRSRAVVILISKRSTAWLSQQHRRRGLNHTERSLPFQLRRAHANGS